MIIWMEVIFWVSLVGLAYIFVGYPLLVYICAQCAPTRRQRHYVPRQVSIVMSVYNDAHHLPAKLHSIFAMNNSNCVIEVLVGSDGSTDEIDKVCAGYPDPRVHLIPFAARRGKPAVLNDLIPRCRGEIVLLTDARQRFDAAFLSNLLASFSDPKVGVVSGELVLTTDESNSTAAEGIGFYWKYEKFIRRAESGFQGVPGATGACYAILKQAFCPIPDTTILDDVAIPMTVINRGYDCIFDSQALAFDKPSQLAGQEAVRKRRTIAGAAQLIRLFPHWLLPHRNRLWLEYVSHKLMRLVAPFLLVSALIANLCLVTIPPYAVLLAIQLSFYVMAGCGCLYQIAGYQSRCFGPALMFITLNVTTAMALWDAVRSNYRVTWRKSNAA